MYDPILTILAIRARALWAGVDAGPLQQLGDCLGKGAFGSVYRALNWNTGETVAVKQIKLTDLPKSELRVIMVCDRLLLATLGTFANTRCLSWKLIF